MKNKHILKVLSLLAALCIAAGCRESTTAETTAGAGTQAETSIVSETTTAAESVSAEVEELEVDHVDEDGIVYYKNPTEWTYEKFFSQLTINGNEIESPLTISKLGNGFSTESIEQIEYNPETGFCAVQLLYNDLPFAMAIFKHIDDINAVNNEQIDMIKQVFDYTVVESNYGLLKINGVGMNSKKEQVKNALGIPRGEQQWLLIYDDDKMSFAFSDSDEVISVTIDFQKMEENK